MITGFNTDVEHDGVTYHVQTEDKGLKSPLILSLVYVGGTILASKRTPYDDLITAGFDENKLAERLQRQHKLICAAIHTGRIEDLKRQTERDATSRAKSTEQEEPKEELKSEEVKTEQSPKVKTEDAPTKVKTDEAPEVSLAETVEPAATAPVDEGIVHEDLDIIRTDSLADFMPPSIFMTPPAPKVEPAPPPVKEVPPPSQPVEHVDYSRVVDYDGVITPADELQINLVDEKRFVAGEFVKINVQLKSGVDDLGTVSDAVVTLKVLGTSFRPLIFSEKTAPDGTVTFYAMLPYFTSGRAAILINATTKGYRAELRRVIHQA